MALWRTLSLERRNMRAISTILTFLILLQLNGAFVFDSLSQSNQVCSFTASSVAKSSPYDPFNVKKRQIRSKRVSTMLFGPSEDFFGIGTPEAIVILGVGWIVLGPTELYKLTKELGGVIGNLREAASSITKGITETIEKEIGMQEIEQNFKSGKLDLDEMWGNTGDFASKPDMNDYVDQKVAEMNKKQAEAKKAEAFMNADQNSTLVEDQQMREKFSAQMDVDEWNKAIMNSQQSIEQPYAKTSFTEEMNKVTTEVTDDKIDDEELMMRKLQALADLEEEKMLEMQQMEKAFVDDVVELKMQALAALEQERIKSMEELQQRFQERRDFIEEMFAPVPDGEKNSTLV